MAYEVAATNRTPALILYLVDVSVSMNKPMSGRTRLEVAADALHLALRRMLERSMKYPHTLPRYRIGVIAYSDETYDLLGGVKSIDQVAALGRIPLTTGLATDTARAFAAAEAVLRQELPAMGACPAPLVCHLTDGEYTGADPEPVAQRIRTMSVPDGHVLIQNIIMSDRILPEPVRDPARWPGILPDTRLPSAYAQKLRRMSSPLPESYRTTMMKENFSLALGALMMLPGTSPDMVALGFQQSVSTPDW